MLSTITRYPNGLNNEAPGQSLQDLKVLNPFTYNLLYDDFNAYTATQWTQSGTGSVALQTSADGGVVNVVTPVGGPEGLQWGAPQLAFTPNLANDLFFAARVRLNSVAPTLMLIGLTISSADPIGVAPANGIYIRKAASGLPIATLRIGSADVAAVPLGAMADNVWYEFVLAYTAADGMLRAYQNDAAYLVAANPTALPAVALGPNLAISDSTAAARTMGVDYIMAAKAR